MFHLLACVVATFAMAIVPHPHVPKAIVLGGAAGKITCSYFTVPYNPEHLEGLKAGFRWHLGFAALDSEVPLTCGDVKIPPGKYKLDIRLVEGKGDAAKWEGVLKLITLVTAESAVQRAGRQSNEAKEKAEKALAELKAKLEAEGKVGEVTLPTSVFQAASDEHLVMRVISDGFETVSRTSVEPKSGIEFTLRLGWGDLHRELTLKESFAKR